MGNFADLQKDVGRPFQVLLYGAPGTMKTIQAHSFPRPRTIDCDNGLLSIRSAVKAKIIPEPIGWKYETIVETQFGKHGYVKKATAFDQVCLQIDAWLKEEAEDESQEFDTIIVDSATSLSEFSLNQSLEEMDRLGMSKSKSQGSTAGLQIVKMQDYGGALKLFQQFIDWIRGLDKNIVLVCHEYEQTSDEGTVEKILPLLIGQLRQKISKDFDEVWRNTFKGVGENRKVVTQTAGTNKVVAKSRLGVFKAEEDLLTYQRIMEKLNA